MQYSEELMEQWYGDEAVLAKLDRARVGFIDGNKGCLFYAILVCGQYQAVIPDWVTDELLRIDNSLINGALNDYNEAFGWEAENKATRKKAAKLRNLTPTVLSELTKLRCEGASLTSDDIMATAADQLQISRRDIEDIYKLSGQFLKDIPQGNTENNRYVQSHTFTPPHCRSGRPILRD